MAFNYRCMKCRGRNRFHKPVEWYVRPRKCRHCGHGRFYVALDRLGRPTCRCDGLIGRTGPIPHRPGSPGCVTNPMHQYHRARVMGADRDTLLDILIEIAWSGEGGRIVESDTAPF
jgi:hypothetical protein